MRTLLKKDEKVLLIIRHHWLQLVMPFFIWIVVGVLAASFLDPGTALAVILVAAVYPLFIYFTWIHNIWAVTNLRVIDEGGLFTRHAKESPLDKINNIEYEQSFWGRLLGFGNVDSQTAAEMGETNYRMIYHPKLLKDTITHAQEEYKSMQSTRQADQLARAIAGHVSQQSSAPGGMVADELKKMFGLLQAGAITQGEYLQQKNKLLNK